VVDARHGADRRPGAKVLGHEVGDVAGLLVGPQHVGGRRDHAAPHVDAVDGVGVLARGEGPHDDAAQRIAPGHVPVQPVPVRVRRIDEQLLGRLGHEHVRIAGVEADVPRPLGLVAEVGHDGRRRAERLAEQHPPPAHVDHDVSRHRRHKVLGRLLPARGRDGVVPVPPADQAVRHGAAVGVLAAGPLVGRGGVVGEAAVGLVAGNGPAGPLGPVALGSAHGSLTG
jgi:hypothetical protein